MAKEIDAIELLTGLKLSHATIVGIASAMFAIFLAVWLSFAWRWRPVAEAGLFCFIFASVAIVMREKGLL